MARRQRSARRADDLPRLPPVHVGDLLVGRTRAVRRHRAHPARHGDPCRREQPRDGAVARRQYPVPLPRGVCGRSRAGRVRGHDRRTGVLGVSRHGQPGADRVLRRRRHRRHRLDPRRLHRVAPGGRGRHLRQGLLPAGGRRARLCADGGGPPVAARRPVSRDMTAASGARSAWPSSLVTWAVVALIAAFPWFGGRFYVDLALTIMISAIFALSLELLVGMTGLVSFGHAAFFGIAAYAVALLSPAPGAPALWWLLPAAVGLAALYAAIVGALSLR